MGKSVILNHGTLRIYFPPGNRRQNATSTSHLTQGRFMTIVKKIENYFVKAEGNITISNNHLFEIILVELKAITKLIEKRIKKKNQDNPSTISTLMNIASRNIQICSSTLNHELEMYIEISCPLYLEENGEKDSSILHLKINQQ